MKSDTGSFSDFFLASGARELFAWIFKLNSFKNSSELLRPEQVAHEIFALFQLKSLQNEIWAIGGAKKTNSKQSPPQKFASLLRGISVEI
jgi:hypothetical protein